MNHYLKVSSCFDKCKSYLGLHNYSLAKIKQYKIFKQNIRYMYNDINRLFQKARTLIKFCDM